VVVARTDSINDDFDAVNETHCLWEGWSAGFFTMITL